MGVHFSHRKIMVQGFSVHLIREVVYVKQDGGDQQVSNKFSNEQFASNSSSWASFLSNISFGFFITNKRSLFTPFVRICVAVFAFCFVFCCTVLIVLSVAA